MLHDVSLLSPVKKPGSSGTFFYYYGRGGLIPVKSKIFAVVMAVMALVSCMCIPALAAEKVAIQNGVPFSASHWSDDSSGQLQYLEIEHGVTYTITTDPSITKLTLWIYKPGSRANGSITFVDGIAEYTCTDTNVRGIVMLCDDAGNRPTVTVSWPLPPFFERLGTSIADFTTGVVSGFGTPVLAFITSNPLCLIPAIMGLVVLCICLVRRFVYGA